MSGRPRLSRRRLLLVLAIGLGAVVLIPPAAALGFFGPRTYLVLSQDPAELRPYGGYVGTYGAVELLFGHVNSVEYGDSKDLDTGGDTKLFAASESPDFPTAASSMADAYRWATDAHVDAVIALDPAAASGLLELVGPLEVPGEPRPITPSNLLGIVLEHTQNFEHAGGRKQFVYDLGIALAKRLRNVPPTRWPNVLQAVGRAADERHVQVYAEDRLLQHLAHVLGWDGAFPLPVNDFLAVVDDNIGYNKANLVTEQTLEYQVVVDANGGATATLTIGYANQGVGQLTFDARAMPYLNGATYEANVSVYVPAGSQRLARAALSDYPPSLGRTVFAEQVRVPPDTQQILQFRYRLPDRPVQVGRVAYNLLVRKQPGTLTTPLHVSVTGPEGWHVIGDQGREWSAQSLLTTDRHFDVAFEASQAR